MARDLDVNDIASMISSGDVISIGVDSIKYGANIIYNLSVIVRTSHNGISTIWTKDIEESIVDDTYRDMRELNLLSELYKELYEHIKSHKVNFSLKIHKNWFNRFKYEKRNNKLQINFCPCGSVVEQLISNQ